MKKLILVLVVLPYFSLGQSSSLEEKAVKQFCQNYDDLISFFGDSEIIFSGKINTEPSRVYDVAHCFKDINLFTYKVGENIILDSLANLSYDKIPSFSRRLNFMCPTFKTRAFCKRKKFLMDVHLAKSYIDEKKVVQLSFYHRYDGNLVIYCILFDNDDQIVEECITSMLLD